MTGGRFGYAAKLILVGVFILESACDEVYDVIILGGGIAGINAARTLVNEGINNFIIIEGRDQLGGRIQSHNLGGYTVELAALWIQGAEDNSENPMYNEVLKYNLSAEYNDYDDILYYDDNGHNITEEAMERCDILFEALDMMYEYIDELRSNPQHGDMSVRAALQWFGFNPEKTASGADMICDYFEFDFEFAYEPSVMSASFLDLTYDDFGDGDLYVTDSRGYASIPRNLLADNVEDWEDKVYFETVVTSVQYQDNAVTVTTNKGDFTGKKAIVTFSLGVLKNNGVSFSPDLPKWKLESIHEFLFSDYLSVFIKFAANIKWFVPDNTEWIMYASTRRGYFPVWQNLDKFLPGSHIIQATVTNTEARRLQTLSDGDVKQEAMAVLRKMFGPEIPDAENILFSRLHFDPFFYGSYATWPIGFTAEQHKALRAPIGPVYFAGEAYSQKYYGYTHGAMISAEATAKEVAICLKDAGKCHQPYVPPYSVKGCTYRFATNYDPNALLDDGSCIIIYPTFNSGRQNCFSSMEFAWLLTFLLICLTL